MFYTHSGQISTNSTYVRIMDMNTRDAINASLRIIGRQGFSGITVKAPNALEALDSILKKSPARTHSSTILKELRRQGLADIASKDVALHFTLTPAGLYRLQQITISEIKITMPRKWDGRWRAVSFDIPVQFSKQRVAFVDHLQAHGFVMLQKSFWVHPANCLDQIETIASHYNIVRYCSLLELSKLDNATSARLKRKFSRLTS